MEDGNIFSISSVWRSAEPTLPTDSRASHLRIPGEMAMLHIRIAVIFTSRLRGVKTCNLDTGGFRVCGGASEPGLPYPLRGSETYLMRAR